MYNLSVLTKEAQNILSEVDRVAGESRGHTSLGMNVSINGNTYFIRYNFKKELVTFWIPLLKNDGVGDYYDFRYLVKSKDFKCTIDDIMVLKEAHPIFKKIDKFITESSGHKLDNGGCIYLVSDGYHTKIWATSYNVTKRLNELQTWNSSELSIVGFYPVKNKISSESYIHTLFAEKRIRWEWFLLSPDEVQLILGNKYSKINEYGYSSLTPEWVKDILSVSGTMYWEYKAIENKVEKRKSNKISEMLTSPVFEKIRKMLKIHRPPVNLLK